MGCSSWIAKSGATIAIWLSSAFSVQWNISIEGTISMMNNEKAGKPRGYIRMPSLKETSVVWRGRGVAGSRAGCTFKPIGIAALVQWYLPIEDTTGSQLAVLYREVSLIHR